jgi:hypothetical protein
MAKRRVADVLVDTIIAAGVNSDTDLQSPKSAPHSKIRIRNPES